VLIEWPPFSRDNIGCGMKRQTHWIYDSRDIIGYLEGRFLAVSKIAAA